MRRDPLLVVTATLTLAVAIGAGTTVFSLVDSILLRPLPFRDPGRIYWVAERSVRNPMGVGFGADYYSLRERKQVFDEVGAFDTLTVNWSGIDRPEQLDSAVTTPSFFSVLGTRPLLGRTFDETEQGARRPRPSSSSATHSGAPASIAIPAVLTRSLTLDGIPHRIIGVMPQGFDYPKDTQLWRPMEMDEPSQRPRSAMRPIRLVRMIARVRANLDDRQRAGHPPYPDSLDRRRVSARLRRRRLPR